VNLAQARARVDTVVAAAPDPVSVFVADDERLARAAIERAGLTAP
jgi:hypothetical protein